MTFRKMYEMFKRGKDGKVHDEWKPGKNMKEGWSKDSGGLSARIGRSEYEKYNKKKPFVNINGEYVKEVSKMHQEENVEGLKKTIRDQQAKIFELEKEIEALRKNFMLPE